MTLDEDLLLFVKSKCHASRKKEATNCQTHLYHCYSGLEGGMGVSSGMSIKVDLFSFCGQVVDTKVAIDEKEQFGQMLNEAKKGYVWVREKKSTVPAIRNVQNGNSNPELSETASL